MLPTTNSISYWLRGPQYDKWKTFRSTVQLPSSADVVVIDSTGAGMTGASCALRLMELGVRNVVLIDARGIGEGATGRNAGHLWTSPFYVTIPTKEMIDKYGVEELRKEVAFQYHNTRLMLQFIKDHNVPCDLQFTGSLRIATTPEELKDLKLYLDTLNELGLNLDNNITFWDAEKCKAAANCPDALGGLHYGLAGQAWAVQLVWTMCELIHGKGGNVQAQTPVLKVEKVGSQYKVVTERGNIICNKVVYATNAYTSALVPELKDIIVPTRGQLIVTSPLEKMHFPMPIWINYGHEYVNQRVDKRLMVGGMRWTSPTKESGEVDDGVVSPIVSKALRQFVETTFPQIKNENWKVDYEWTGIMAFTPDENPLVGRLRDNEYIAAGFTGYGMPRAYLCGRVVADMIAGNPDPQLVLKQYDPARFVKRPKL